MSDGLNGQTPSEAEQQANAFIAQNEHDGGWPRRNVVR